MFFFCLLKVPSMDVEVIIIRLVGILSVTLCFLLLLLVIAINIVEYREHMRILGTGRRNFRRHNRAVRFHGPIFRRVHVVDPQHEN